MQETKPYRNETEQVSSVRGTQSNAFGEAASLRRQALEEEKWSAEWPGPQVAWETCILVLFPGDRKPSGQGSSLSGVRGKPAL